MGARTDNVVQGVLRQQVLGAIVSPQRLAVKQLTALAKD
jgi:hypothetical protein